MDAIQFWTISLPAYAHCTGGEKSDHVIGNDIRHQITQGARDLTPICMSVISFGRLVTSAYVDPAYCRCCPSTDHSLYRLVTLLSVFLNFHAKIWYFLIVFLFTNFRYPKSTVIIFTSSPKLLLQYSNLGDFTFWVTRGLVITIHAQK